MKVFGVTGWKNSGKTGLVERLVSEFISRGLSVSTVSMHITLLMLIILVGTVTAIGPLGLKKCFSFPKIDGQ